jgi:hypothetical protein
VSRGATDSRGRLLEDGLDKCYIHLVGPGNIAHTFHAYDRQHMLNHSKVCGPPSCLIVTLAREYLLVQVIHVLR